MLDLASIRHGIGIAPNRKTGPRIPATFQHEFDDSIAPVTGPKASELLEIK